MLKLFCICIFGPAQGFSLLVCDLLSSGLSHERGLCLWNQPPNTLPAPHPRRFTALAFAHAAPELQLSNFSQFSFNSMTAAGGISLRHAENEGFERTEEEAYVLITNVSLKG